MADHIIIFQKGQEPILSKSTYKEWLNKNSETLSSAENTNDAMLAELELTSVLSQLSVETNAVEKEKLEKRFQQLLNLKNRS